MQRHHPSGPFVDEKPAVGCGGDPDRLVEGATDLGEDERRRVVADGGRLAGALAAALAPSLGPGGSAGRLGVAPVLGLGEAGTTVGLGAAPVHAASSAAVAKAAILRPGCFIGLIVSESV